jgi:hypothetical protein
MVTPTNPVILAKNVHGGKTDHFTHDETCTIGMSCCSLQNPWRAVNFLRRKITFMCCVEFMEFRSEI